ncbi:phytanoyl-CoA dioxygenase family protein [Mariprofundus ferrooxydans]|uniref:phytanoyl-CoA dioxygenase family protein n=1 Tax=Mariprofundus ferrooxydans TaxID=314344 RepID=UPI001431B2DA|nr:phytanoyl-CoA dioxygenase family protein [Mariprofundus ferrooxydans]
MLIDNVDQARFAEDGVLIIRGFYDLEKEIKPIQLAIYDLIGMVIEKYDLPITREPFSHEGFDSGFNELIAMDRRYGAEVYDAVKQIPSFIRLLAKQGHEDVFKSLRPNSFPGIAAGGYGMRIDNPFEEKFRANWHQEYPAQLRSMDGLVYWTPLLRVTEELGPVEFCLGSHKDGVVPVYTTDPNNPEKRGAYSLVLQDEAECLSRYEHVSPLTEPGDLVVIDFLVLHASGHNKSRRSRWSMQMRYFNFNESTGRSHGWKGSYASGVDFRQIHPELCAD